MKIKTFSEWVRDEYHLPDGSRWDVDLVGRNLDGAFRLLSEYIDGYMTYVSEETIKIASLWGEKASD